MIVRCGKCKIELEVAGPGEFMCPSCGSRNVVRGAAPDPTYGLPDLGGPLRPPPPPQPEGPPPGVSWIVCPRCSWRFAVGEVTEVACPTCGTSLTVDGGVARIASA